jgi:hypothetical protein
VGSAVTGCGAAGADPDAGSGGGAPKPLSTTGTFSNGSGFAVADPGAVFPDTSVYELLTTGSRLWTAARRSVGTAVRAWR